MCRKISILIIFLTDLVEEFRSAWLVAITEMTGALLVGSTFLRYFKTLCEPSKLLQKLLTIILQSIFS